MNNINDVIVYVIYGILHCKYKSNTYRIATTNIQIFDNQNHLKKSIQN